MPKVTAAALAVTAVFVLGLTGCAGANGSATAERTAPETSEPATPSETPEPLKAESPATEADADQLFLAEARDRLSGLGSATTIPNASDEQLIAAGHEACDALMNQQPFNDVSVVQGEERVQGSYLDSAAIASAAILYFCPEINGKTL